MKKEISKSMEKAMSRGYIINNSMEAHIANHFKKLFNGDITIKANMKTDSIPVFSIPNIKLQVAFLNVMRHNEQLWDSVPNKDQVSFLEFVDYMKNNKMCVNCQGCMKDCYNNKAYYQYPQKGIADLRNLYELVTNTDATINKIVKATENSKFVRLNGSGEIHNSFILDCYSRIAELNDDTKYYTYTKNYEILVDNEIPNNLIINVSDFGTRDIIDRYDIDDKYNEFIAIDKEELDKKELKPNEYRCPGTSCSSCKLCTKNLGKKIYCAIH